MRVVEKYSHLNGEEFLLVHREKAYKEILKIINLIDAGKYKTKMSEEKTMKGIKLFSPIELNKAFKIEFEKIFLISWVWMLTFKISDKYLFLHSSTSLKTFSANP